MHKTLCSAPLLALLAAFATPVQAERADRNQPVNIEANKVTVDDRNKVHVFEGNVILTQGTLTIRGDKVVVTQDVEGFQKGVATASGGGLAHFRQKREGKPDFVEGEAERIEYDSKSEKAKLFIRAWVKSAGDEVRGQYIEYDGYTENYLVNNGNAPAAGATPGSRVTATIQPKNATPQTPAAKP
jgi:lipopolysaccharide export system protein LptA